MGGSTVYAHAHARRARMQYELLDDKLLLLTLAMSRCISLV